MKQIGQGKIPQSALSNCTLSLFSPSLQMLSNVHTIRVVNVDKDQRTWNFTNKVMDNMRSLEFSEFFIRSNQTHANIGILFELCMSYRRTVCEKPIIINSHIFSQAIFYLSITFLSYFHIFDIIFLYFYHTFYHIVPFSSLMNVTKSSKNYLLCYHYIM